MRCCVAVGLGSRSIRISRCCFRNWPSPSRRRQRCRLLSRRIDRAGAQSTSRTVGVAPARELRREQRRYELTALERLCPECGDMRREIGVLSTEQYDYKPAEVFVIEHQRVKYACKCCEGHVAIAPEAAAASRQGVARAGPDGADHRRQIPGSHSAAPHRAAFRTARRQAATLDHVRLDGLGRRVADTALAVAQALGVAIEGAAHRRHHRAGARRD